MPAARKAGKRKRVYVRKRVTNSNKNKNTNRITVKLTAPQPAGVLSQGVPVVVQTPAPNHDGVLSLLHSIHAGLSSAAAAPTPPPAVVPPTAPAPVPTPARTVSTGTQSRLRTRNGAVQVGVRTRNARLQAATRSADSVTQTVAGTPPAQQPIPMQIATPTSSSDTLQLSDASSQTIQTGQLSGLRLPTLPSAAAPAGVAGHPTQAAVYVNGPPRPLSLPARHRPPPLQIENPNSQAAGPVPMDTSGPPSVQRPRFVGMQNDAPLQLQTPSAFITAERLSAAAAAAPAAPQAQRPQYPLLENGPAQGAFAHEMPLPPSPAATSQVLRRALPVRVAGSRMIRGATAKPASLNALRTTRAYMKRLAMDTGGIEALTQQVSRNLIAPEVAAETFSQIRKAVQARNRSQSHSHPKVLRTRSARMR